MAAHKGVPPDIQAERDRRLKEKMVRRGTPLVIQEGSILSTILKLNKADREEIAKRKAPPAKPKRGEKTKAIEEAITRLGKAANGEAFQVLALGKITGVSVASEVLRASGWKVTPRAVLKTMAWKAFADERSRREEDERKSRILKRKTSR